MLDDCRNGDCFLLLLFLMGIREGRQKREEENDYLEKLQAEQQMAKVGEHSEENIDGRTDGK